MVEKKCLTCGKDIIGRTARAMYCSVPCNKKAAHVRCYGLEIPEYNQLKASLAGKCPICLRNVRKWHLDHCHKTDESFGLVCHNCNTHLLAFTYHDPSVAWRLYEFLNHPPIRRLFGPRYVNQRIRDQVSRSKKPFNGRRRRKK